MGLFDKFRQNKFEIKSFGKVKKEDIAEIEKKFDVYLMITKNSCQITMVVQFQIMSLMRFI